MLKRIVFAGVVVALTATQSHAGCGLLGKIFGGRCSQPSYTVRGCQGCQASTETAKPVEYSAPVVVRTGDSCPNGQCANQVLAPVRGIRFFGR